MELGIRLFLTLKKLILMSWGFYSVITTSLWLSKKMRFWLEVELSMFILNKYLCINIYTKHTHIHSKNIPGNLNDIADMRIFKLHLYFVISSDFRVIITLYNGFCMCK